MTDSQPWLPIQTNLKLRVINMISTNTSILIALLSAVAEDNWPEMLEGLHAAQAAPGTVNADVRGLIRSWS